MQVQQQRVVAQPVQTPKSRCSSEGGSLAGADEGQGINRSPETLPRLRFFKEGCKSWQGGLHTGASKAVGTSSAHQATVAMSPPVLPKLLLQLADHLLRAVGAVVIDHHNLPVQLAAGQGNITRRCC